MTGPETMPHQAGLDGLLSYEELLAGRPDTITWPEFDENAAAGLCYTSGTTGEPKGVLIPTAQTSFMPSAASSALRRPSATAAASCPSYPCST